jgi:hypothetical protein
MIIVSKLAAFETIKKLRNSSDFIRTKLREGRVMLKKKANSTDPPPVTPTDLKSPASQTEGSTPPNPASDFSSSVSGPVTPVVGGGELPQLKKYKEKLLNKTAVSLEQLRTAVTKTVKPNWIRASARGGLGKDFVRRGGATSFFVTRENPRIFAAQSLGDRLVNGVNYYGPNSFSGRLFSQDVNRWKGLSDIEREVANRTALLHEGVELDSLRRLGPNPEWRTRWQSVRSSHAAPDVILRENNVLATLPEQQRGAVTQFYRGMRPVEELALGSVVPNYLHGQRRFSRHAIKRIREVLERPLTSIEARAQRDVYRTLT